MKSHVLFIGLFFQFLSFSIFSQEFSTLDEIYDFDPEDKFQTIHYNCCNEVFFKVQEVKILERNETQDINQYIRSTSLFSFVFSNPPILVDTFYFNLIDTLTIHYPDSIIFTSGDEIISNASIYNGRKVNIKYSTVLGRPKTDKYVNGCGLAVTSWYFEGDSSCKISDSLVYFKKEKEEWGENRFLSTNALTRKPELSIYPNPTNNILDVRCFNPDSKTFISLFDLTGKKLTETIPCQKDKIHQLDLSNYKKGVYLLLIKSQDRNQVHRIIKP